MTIVENTPKHTIIKFTANEIRQITALLEESTAWLEGGVRSFFNPAERLLKLLESKNKTAQTGMEIVIKSGS